jgi:HSP20 family protein
VLGKLAEAGDKHVERHGEFRIKGLGDKARGVFGFSVRTGIGGAPRVEPFGNVHKTESGVVVDEVREPLFDLFDERDELLITAEVPGVKDEDITVAIRGDILLIETKGHRLYFKEIQLPCSVDAKSLHRTYNNGIVEIRLKKAQGVGAS